MTDDEFTPIREVMLPQKCRRVLRSPQASFANINEHIRDATEAFQRFGLLMSANRWNIIRERDK